MLPFDCALIVTPLKVKKLLLEGTTNMVNIEIVYCAVWHYTDRAVSLATDLLKNFEYDIGNLVLVPSDGGKFEITVGDKLVYSKLETKRHAEPGEVVGLVRKALED